MLAPLKKRCLFWWQAIRSTWGFPVLIIGGVWGILSTFRDELLSQEAQQKYQLIALLPQWSGSAWIIIGLGAVIIVLLEAGYRSGNQLQAQLNALSTPSVKMELDMIEEDLLSQKGQTLFIRIMNCSAKYIRPEVFAIEIISIEKGHEYLYTHHSAPPSFGLNPGESHPLPIINYKNSYSQPFQLLVPNKKGIDEAVKGKEFIGKLAAYGGSAPAILEFNFGVDDQTLWAKVDESEIIMSHLRLLAGKVSEAIAEEIKKEE
jgi:hypothetical protein